MNEHLQKVANDLQQAYDTYRSRVSDYEQRVEDANEKYDAYNAKKPGWENPLRVAAPIVGTIGGGLIGARLGKPHGIGDAGVLVGGGAGLVTGLVGQYGIRAGLDAQDPERVPLRHEKNLAVDVMADSANGLEHAQEMMAIQGRRDLPGMYGLLQPGDPYDRMLESSIHASLLEEENMKRERQQLETDALRANVEKERSKATKNNAAAFQKLQS